jgi:uncharacterized protein (TIGR01777 family)
MKVAIAGSTGFLGQALVKSSNDLQWITLDRHMLYQDPAQLGDALKETRVVVNLAGSPIIGRWNKRNRKLMLNSRITVNRNLVQAINGIVPKPELFITASAIGYYDDHHIHGEDSEFAGTGFLSELTKQWEYPLESLDISVRAVRARIGIVLGQQGGMLGQYMRFAKLGVIPLIGSGKQVMSFIHIEDFTAAIRYIAHHGSGGVYNLCSPFPVDHATFMKTLAALTGVRLVPRIPGVFLAPVMGNSRVMVTRGQHVVPERLMAEGFAFKYPRVEDALENLITAS